MSEQRTLITIDAAGKSYGRLASEVAAALIGKDKPGFVYSKDMGSAVAVENIRFVRVTGSKLEQKKYYHHSKYQGGMHVKLFRDVFAKTPAKTFSHTVYRMLPKNSFREQRIKRLTVR